MKLWDYEPEDHDVPPNRPNVINVNALKHWIYPGGEVGVRLDALQHKTCVRADIVSRIHNSVDFMKTTLVLSAVLETKGVGAVRLFLPYLPYARQDRVATEGDPNAVRALFSMLPDGLEVHVIDAHSAASAEHAKACAVKFVNHSPLPCIQQYLATIKAPCILVSPDKGAIEKTRGYAEALNLPAAYCTKKRDPTTGALTGFEVALRPGKIHPDSHFVIVDDICDGGGTFHGVDAALVDAGLGQYPSHLWTTHGIYSKGTEALLETFQTIGCTDSYRQDYAVDSRHVVIPVFT